MNFFYDAIYNHYSIGTFKLMEIYMYYDSYVSVFDVKLKHDKYLYYYK